jgi:uncharacterized protein YggU (UPF0235/DUF167 family)
VTIPALNIEMATHYTEEEKSLWVYISNVSLAQGKRDEWKTVISREIDPTNTKVDLKSFKRITPPMYERHLVLEAPNTVARRTLLDALKASRSHVRIHLHLTPLGKANKTLVYYQAKKNMVKIVDRGDMVHICWKSDESSSVILDVHRSAEEV